MRNHYLTLAVLFLTAVSCHKSSENSLANATLYYGGMTNLCSCCASWFVQIDGETERRSVYQLPSDANLPGSEEQRSMRVHIEWEPTKDQCIKQYANAVDITSLRKIP